MGRTVKKDVSTMTSAPLCSREGRMLRMEILEGGGGVIHQPLDTRALRTAWPGARGTGCVFDEKASFVGAPSPEHRSRGSPPKTSREGKVLAGGEKEVHLDRAS